MTLFDQVEQRCTHLIGSVHDMTDQKQVERALKTSEREFRAIFDRAPLGIAVIDSTTGEFRKVNQQYCSIAGYSESEMLELTFHSITHPDDLQEDLDGMQRLMSGKLNMFQMEKRYLRKDGSIIWVHLTCVPLWEAPGTDLPSSTFAPNHAPTGSCAGNVRRRTSTSRLPTIRIERQLMKGPQWTSVYEFRDFVR